MQGYEDRAQPNHIEHRHHRVCHGSLTNFIFADWIWIFIGSLGLEDYETRTQTVEHEIVGHSAAGSFLKIAVGP